MFTIHIDPHSSTPIWSQIEQQVQLLVASGRLSPGEALPSVRELASELIVNPATVAKAYRRLCDLGVAEVRRGQGTFVAERSAASGADRELSRREAENACSRYVAVARTAGLDLDAAREVLHETWAAMDAVGERRDGGAEESDKRGTRKEPA